MDKQNALWAIHGFLKGLDTGQVGDDSIPPSQRRVSMTAQQYKEILDFVLKSLDCKN